MGAGNNNVGIIHVFPIHLSIFPQKKNNSNINQNQEPWKSNPAAKVECLA